MYFKGHFAKDCPSKRGDRGGGKGGDRSGGDKGCFNCGKPGHFAKV